MANLPVKDRPKTLAYTRLMEARNELQSKAKDLVDAYMKTVDAAIKKGEYEVALKAIQWALEHMPEEDGVRVLENSVDKIKTESQGSGGPSVTISVPLGGYIGVGAQAPAQIEAPIVEVIDVEKVDN